MRLRSIWFVIFTIFLIGCRPGETGQPGPLSAPTRVSPPLTTPWPTATTRSTSPLTEAQRPNSKSNLPPLTSDQRDWTHYPSFNQINSLDFGPNGALWAATESGVIRWDLATDMPATYTTAEGLVANFARDLIVAPDGALWVATLGGVSHFDGTTWTSYTEADGLPSQIIYAITLAPDGSVWVGTDGGAGHFDGATWTSYTPAEGLADTVVWSVAVAPNGEVWFSTHAGGVSRYNPAQETWTTYTTESGLPLPNARFLTLGPDGAPWLHIGYDHVYRFDGQGWRPSYESGGGQWICDITFAAGGTPWIGTCGGYHAYGAGLVHHDGQAWVYTTVEDGLISNDITAVALDLNQSPNEIIAAGSGQGLSVYQAGRWRALRAGPTLNKVTTAAVTPDGALWAGFGTAESRAAGGGLSRFDGQRWQYVSRANGFPLSDNVRLLAVAPDGALWAGAGCGLARRDGQTWRTVATCDQLSGNVHDLAFSTDGTVWVATDFHVYRFDGQTWTTYQSKIPLSMTADVNDVVWVSHAQMAGGGISAIDGDTWTTYPGDPPLDQVNALVAANDGTIWAGTYDQGVVRFDGQSWTGYTTAEGLPSNRVFELRLAPDGRLWAITDLGLAYFDGNAWLPFGHPAGTVVQTLAFAPEGIMWLGTDHGVIKLDGDE